MTAEQLIALAMSGRGTGCPVCGGLSFRGRQRDDEIFCPTHGSIPGLLADRLRKLDRIDALIELRGAQALAELHEMAKRAVWWTSPFSWEGMHELYHDERYGLCQRIKPGFEIRSYSSVFTRPNGVLDVAVYAAS